MPVKECRLNNRPGYKWGDEGKCYTYDPGSSISRNRARESAANQGRAIESAKQRLAGN